MENLVPTEAAKKYSLEELKAMYKKRQRFKTKYVKIFQTTLR
jgi:hypothetical protein